MGFRFGQDRPLMAERYRDQLRGPISHEAQCRLFLRLGRAERLADQVRELGPARLDERQALAQCGPQGLAGGVQNEAPDATARREAGNRIFATRLSEWNESGASGHDPLPVERVLDRVVAPLARELPDAPIVITSMLHDESIIATIRDGLGLPNRIIQLAR